LGDAKGEVLKDQQVKKRGMEAQYGDLEAKRGGSRGKCSTLKKRMGVRYMEGRCG
jgi:hypothetical protein